MFFTGTVSSVMEGNVIALGICIISIDQASYYFSCSALAVREDCAGLASQPPHMQAGPQSLTQLRARQTVTSAANKQQPQARQLCETGSWGSWALFTALPPPCCVTLGELPTHSVPLSLHFTLPGIFPLERLSRPRFDALIKIKMLLRE